MIEPADHALDEGSGLDRGTCGSAASQSADRVQNESAASVPLGYRRANLPNLHLRFSERKLLLATMDLVAINLALVTSLVMRVDGSSVRWEQLSASVWDRLLWFALLSGLWLTAASLWNAYDLARAASAADSIWASCGAAVFTALVYMFIPYVTPSFPVRRLEAFALPVLAALAVGSWRLVYAKVFVQPVFQQRALVVGAGWAGRTLAQAITETEGGDVHAYHGTGYCILGFIDDDPTKQGQDVAGIPVMGGHRDLVRLVRELQPDELTVAITDVQSMRRELFQAILICREMGTQITTMSSLYERITGRVPVEHAGRDLNVVLPVAYGAGHRVYLVARRLLDLGAGVLGCAFVAVLSPAIWIANRLSSPGSLFFYQERVGQGGRVFRVVKFRSMIVNAEEHCGVVWAREDDGRVTQVGRILRKTRLDESPQFWNVLKGDMSLIGPRPERPEFVTQLAQQIPFYRARHAVKPGITGWAQVKYRYGASVDDALVKLQYDLYYIKHHGPYLDLLILLKTVQVVLGLKGR